VSREAVLGTGDLRSADPGDLSAARGALGGVPCAALALGTAGLRALGVGGVPFFSGGGGLLLLFVSAWPDLRSKKPSRNESMNRRLPRAHEDPPGQELGSRTRNGSAKGSNGYSLALGALHCCVAAGASSPWCLVPSACTRGAEARYECENLGGRKEWWVSGFCSAALPLVADHGRRHGVEIAERATRHRFRSAFLWGFMLFRDGNFIRWIFDRVKACMSFF
jgi:hypothetical protein